MPVGTSAVLKLGNTSNPDAKSVSWTWGYRMLDPKTGRYNPYACNNKPDLHYCGKPCGSKAIGHVECDPSSPGDCESCGNACPNPGEPAVMSTGWEGIEFALKCLKVVEAVEDEWNPLHVLFDLDLAAAEEEGVGVYLVLTNEYGDFDVLGCNTTLGGRLDATGWRNIRCPQAQPHQAVITYRVSPPPAPLKHRLTINGTYAMVRAALEDLKYKPPKDGNSKRLRAAHLDQMSTQYQPYETISWNLTVGVCEPDPDIEHPCALLATATPPSDLFPLGEAVPSSQLAMFDMMVHIWEANDAPHISDPQHCYFRPGCIGDVRDIRIMAGGRDYYTVAMTETGPVKVPPTLLAVCHSPKCSACVTEEFEADVTINQETGEILTLQVITYGRGYVSEFAPTFEFLGAGNGAGAIILGEIGASLFAPCPFPQESRGVSGFPDQAELAANCEPEPECSAGSAFPLPPTYPLKILEYYFGQYWRYEDRSEPLALPGIEILDVDLYEGCSYERPACSTMDVTARAQKGTILLNRRQNIDIYKEARNALAWVSNQENANLALRVLLYQTELVRLLSPAPGVIREWESKCCSDPAWAARACCGLPHPRQSVVHNFNSQIVGGADEFIVVSAQDQGFTGFDGVSACFKGEDHTGLGFGKELSCGLRLNLTIVAVNDAPEILVSEAVGTMIDASENMPMLLEALDVVDDGILP